MIIIYHQNNKVVEVKFGKENIAFSQINISKALFEIAALHPNDLIVWCSINFKLNLNLLKFQDIFHHRKIMASYNPLQNSFLPDTIGYVEESPFIKINKNVSYPTWQMSSNVGGIYAEILLDIQNKVVEHKNFDYFLHSVAKLYMPKGLLCYSEPKLLKNSLNTIQKHNTNNFTLFKFVKQHYKTRWIFILLLNLFIYERKIAILPFLTSLLYYRKKITGNLDRINIQSTKNVTKLETIDVIIPTIGRKKYLYDVLKDLSEQTTLPVNVIIVEQNPSLGTISELHYIHDEVWPFKIKHIFIHQSGACNARNLALAQAESKWLFMADDDIRFEKSFLKMAMKQIMTYGINAATYSCLQNNKKASISDVHQWPTFGSGCSIVEKDALENAHFKMEFEFGFGEDADFGMQLRNQGIDVIYFPDPKIIHLKAPVGGFRSKPVFLWNKDLIQPKPSPTVMLYKQLHLTSKQVNGYKTILFFKFYKVQKIKNPIQYYSNFKKQWEVSLFWSNKLKNRA